MSMTFLAVESITIIQQAKGMRETLVCLRGLHASEIERGKQYQLYRESTSINRNVQIRSESENISNFTR